MSKVLKAQFNNMCVSGLLLDMQSTVIFAGENKNSSIEVTPNGIGINPGIGNSLYIGTYSKKGPMYKESTAPIDYLPGIANYTARKEVEIPFVDQALDLAASVSSYVKLTGVLL